MSRLKIEKPPIEGFYGGNGLPLDDCWHLFLLDRAGAGLSELTIYGYKRRIIPFLEFFGADTQIKDLNITGLHAYKALLAKKDIGNGQRYKTNSINAYIETVKTFLNWCSNHDEIKHHLNVNPVQFKKMKRPETTPRQIDINDFQTFVDSIPQDTFVGVRFWVYCHLLLDTGLRLAEGTALKLDDVKENYILVNQGKGGKDRLVPISPQMKEILKKWLKIREDSLSAGKIQTDILFPSSEGKQPSNHVISSDFKKYSDLTGIHITAHQLRHTFAITALQNGMDIFRLKEYMGHSSLNSTMIYIRYKNQDLKEGGEEGRFSALKEIKTLSKNDKDKQPRIKRKI